jgi:hypothetical protein
MISCLSLHIELSFLWTTWLTKPRSRALYRPREHRRSHESEFFRLVSHGLIVAEATDGTAAIVVGAMDLCVT